MEPNNSELISEQSFQMMKADYNFDIAPCEMNYDFEDRSRFTKMGLAPLRRCM